MVALQFLNLKINRMNILTLVIIIVVVGVILWLVNSYILMDAKIKRILNIVVVIALIIWLLKAFDVFSYLGGVHI